MREVNMQGCHWIMNCVNQALREGLEEIDLSNAMAYAEDADYQLSIGNDPCFEVKAWLTESGHVERFEVPDQYVEEVGQ